MTFDVRIASAGHRSDVFAEIEYDGEIFAEAFAENGDLKVAFTNPERDQLWVASANDLVAALEKARRALEKAGLLQ